MNVSVSVSVNDRSDTVQVHIHGEQRAFLLDIEIRSYDCGPIAEMEMWISTQRVMVIQPPWQEWAVPISQSVRAVSSPETVCGGSNKRGSRYQ